MGDRDPGVWAIPAASQGTCSLWNVGVPAAHQPLCQVPTHFKNEIKRLIFCIYLLLATSDKRKKGGRRVRQRERHVTEIIDFQFLKCFKFYDSHFCTSLLSYDIIYLTRILTRNKQDNI